MNAFDVLFWAAAAAILIALLKHYDGSAAPHFLQVLLPDHPASRR